MTSSVTSVATFAAFFGQETQMTPSGFSAACRPARWSAISAWLVVKAWIRSNAPAGSGFAQSLPRVTLAKGTEPARLASASGSARKAATVPGL